ncbi:hypothetical protein NECAME_09522 [Necator americanus]|uniref:Beta-lactamase-related domain-containing protein n=1 Tax=Necator americanus TaxID=51031 RepID=W2TFX8_NECAM|nr:hypothetical protein NECAME_09522 [Necator americanus]ETN79912.1 hypothetical protein NECAME_09522 [Necator americanus]
MWYKSARPLAVLTSVLSYGVANKAAIYADHDSTEQNLETFTSLEAKKKKARQLIERQMYMSRHLPEVLLKAELFGSPPYVFASPMQHVRNKTYLQRRATHSTCALPSRIYDRKSSPVAVTRSPEREDIIEVVAGIPGLSVGVTVNGHVVWREGFGFANLESGSRCTEDTVMRIASISKPITAAIAARLIQDGKLDLEKPIQDYLPDFPEKKYEGKPVTISLRQLLSHTAGIRHYKKETKLVF